jgi:hypothetical protein
MAGDVNHDGYGDLIVGAYNYSGHGRVYVYYGSANGLSSTPNWTAEISQTNAQFGYSVGTAGDVNGDGFADILVGAPLFDNNYKDEGRVYVYYGSGNGLNSSPDLTLDGGQAGALFGMSVASAGDINQDGYSDVIVGAPKYDGDQADEGKVFLFNGSSSGLISTSSWSAENHQGGSAFGEVVATASDVNGDGYSDILVGAPAYENGQTNEGRAYLYTGSSSGLSSSPAWWAEGNQTGAYFGEALGTAGDVNGDGFSDVIVGAPRYDGSQMDTGKVYLYYGSSSGLQSYPNWTSEGEQAYAYYGYSISTGGDMNGDGYDDILIGSHLYNDEHIDQGKVYLYCGNSDE